MEVWRPSLQRVQGSALAYSGKAIATDPFQPVPDTAPHWPNAAPARPQTRAPPFHPPRNTAHPQQPDAGRQPGMPNRGYKSALPAIRSPHTYYKDHPAPDRPDPACVPKRRVRHSLRKLPSDQPATASPRQSDSKTHAQSSAARPAISPRARRCWPKPTRLACVARAARTAKLVPRSKEYVSGKNAPSAPTARSPSSRSPCRANNCAICAASKPSAIVTRCCTGLPWRSTSKTIARLAWAGKRSSAA
jgi:hypothetical protein